MRPQASVAIGLAVPSSVRRIVVSVVVWPSRLLIVLFTVAFAAGFRVPDAVQYLPFAASLVLFGLPHGALDHLVPARLSGRAATLSSVLTVGGLYLVLCSLYLAVWFVAPQLAFVLFVALTAFHWGAGDLHAMLAFGPGALQATSAVTRCLVLLSRGGIPMLVPLLAFPGAYRGVAENVADLFFAGVGGLAFAFSPAFRIVAGTALAGAVLLSVLCAALDLPKHRRLVLAYAGETFLLALYFAVVPPILAVGLYFCLWHSTRHIARLVLLSRGAALGARRAVPAVLRFARDAAPLTAVALVLLAALYLVVPGSREGAGSLLALYLVLVSTLTLPHTVVVSYMDLRQGLWRSTKIRQPT